MRALVLPHNKTSARKAPRPRKPVSSRPAGTVVHPASRSTAASVSFLEAPVARLVFVSGESR